MRENRLLLAAVPFAAGALILSGYLSFVKLVTHSMPIGCGAGSDCGEVLASKWSMLLGLPVSLPATLLYAALLVVLILAGRGGTRPWYPHVLCFGACLVIGSAVWFTLLQWLVIHAWCKYCMVDHGLGLFMAVLILVRYWRVAETAKFARRTVVAAVLATAVMGGLQSLNSFVGFAMLDLGSGTDSVIGAGSGRRLVLLDGELELTVGDEMLHGAPAADTVLVMMFDFACPHCRHAHGLIKDLLNDQERGEDLAVCMLVVPLFPTCNMYVHDGIHQRFSESCELARIGLAVWRSNREVYPEFETWMFAEADPPSAVAARQKAVALVGEQSFEAAIKDPWIDARIRRNIKAYGAIGEARRLPLLLLPGRTALMGRMDDVEVIHELLTAPAAGNPQNTNNRD